MIAQVLPHAWKKHLPQVSRGLLSSMPGAGAAISKLVAAGCPAEMLIARAHVVGRAHAYAARRAKEEARGKPVEMSARGLKRLAKYVDSLSAELERVNINFVSSAHKPASFGSRWRAMIEMPDRLRDYATSLRELRTAKLSVVATRAKAVVLAEVSLCLWVQRKTGKPHWPSVASLVYLATVAAMPELKAAKRDQFSHRALRNRVAKLTRPRKS